MSTETQSLAAESPPPVVIFEAYHSALDKVRAVPTASLLPINLDIPIITTMATGAAPKIAALRPQIAAALPQTDLESFDQVPTYAMALAQANSLYLAAFTPKESLQELYDRGYKLREQMVLDLTPLAARGLVDREPLENLKGTNGYLNLATDLMTLSGLACNNWDKVEGKCAVQLSEIKESAEIGQRIMAAVGLRDQTKPGLTEAADIRQRAFTLFVNAYDQARRAISYLRWNEGDVDQIAPSLYSGRNSARRKNDQKSDTPSPTPEAGTAEPGASTAAPAATPVRAGMPGASPYAQ